MKRTNLVNLRFGRLVVRENLGCDSHGNRHWLCECDCGSFKKIFQGSLLNKKTLSCGCLQRERTSEANTQHSYSTEPLHRIWRAIKYRCYGKNGKFYKYYGGRGISVCDSWRTSYLEFRSWALASGYKEGLTIDRIDGDGDYCPENCRWATRLEQANNIRTNIHIEWNGQVHTITEWASILGISRSAFYWRIKHKPLEEVFALLSE